MKIEENLKRDLTSNMELERIFQKHVVDGRSHLFGVIREAPDDEYTLRHEMAKATGTSINDVILVGSAKLGFSVKTENFLSFDEKYGETHDIKDKSDVDIAIVNELFFEKTSEELFFLSNHFDRNWIRNNWTTRFISSNKKKIFEDYSTFHVKGWLRPDLMPNIYLESSSWVPVCRKWRTLLDRQVRVGIYKNWTYLKHYHMDHLGVLKSKITNLEDKYDFITK